MRVVNTYLDLINLANNVKHPLNFNRYKIHNNQCKSSS